MLVDGRYIVLLVVLVGTVVLIRRYPHWATAITIGLAATALAYTLMFTVIVIR